MTTATAGHHKDRTSERQQQQLQEHLELQETPEEESKLKNLTACITTIHMFLAVVGKLLYQVAALLYFRH
jgi:hypothetical protein